VAHSQIERPTPKQKVEDGGEKSLVGRATRGGRVPTRVSTAIFYREATLWIRVITERSELCARSHHVGEGHAGALEPALRLDGISARVFDGDVLPENVVDGISPEEDACVSAVDRLGVLHVDCCIKRRFLSPKPPRAVPRSVVVALASGPPKAVPQEVGHSRQADGSKAVSNLNSRSLAKSISNDVVRDVVIGASIERDSTGQYDILDGVELDGVLGISLVLRPGSNSIVTDVAENALLDDNVGKPDV